jgi:uncharacterized protein (DUF2141 family)
MKVRNGLLFFILLSITIINTVGISGCANIVPPMGGPRDTIPPHLVNANPKDSVTRFTGNKIVLTFDEYIDGKDLRTELLVNPIPKIDPIVDGKLRVVTVRIKDTLQPNTTYSLQFNKGIKDVNEDNIRRNFTYVFSTGDHIDAGEFTGTVLLAATGKVDSTLIAMLHLRYDDSAVVNSRPRYIARVDSTGRFHFRYIQPGSYALYAMKDEGGSHKYLSKSQLFAFADSPVVISRNTPSTTLYAFSEAPETKSASKTGTTATPAKPIPKASQKEKAKNKRLEFQTNLTNNVFDVLDTFRMTFPDALKSFDSTRIRFTTGDFADIDAKTYRWARDTTNKKFALFFGWPVDTKYHLILAREFAQDSAGRRLLKIDTLSFRTKKDIEYGEVRIRIFNLDLSRRPVLQFVQSDAVKYSYPFGNRKEIRKILFPPGDYELRVLYDTNGNGIWDTGQFFGKRRQPEKVVPARKKFTVKANWDNDVDINSL